MSLDEIAPDVDIEKELAAVEADTPTEEVKPEVEAPKEEPKQEKEETKEKLVPLAALHESRMKEREARAKAEKLEAEAAERFKKLEERLAKLANPEKPVPSFQEDPAANLKHEVESLKPVTKEVEQLKQNWERQQADQALVSAMNAAETEFVAAQPDYYDAVNYLRSVSDRNLQALGVEDQSQRVAIIRDQASNIVKRALETGKNPAQIAYEMAKNYGYQAKKAEPDISKKLETIEKGQKATPSMPSGGKKETSLSLAALEQMSDEEFNKLIDDDSQWNKLIRQ